MSDNDDHDRKDDHIRNRIDGGEPAKPKEPSADGSEYVVGYKRPPERTRYKPGQSGNPKGRSKGSKNTSTLLSEELNKRMSVTENGRKQSITKRQAIVKRSVNTAITDAKAALTFLVQALRTESSGEQPNAAPAPLPSGPEQERMFDEFLSRVRASTALEPEPLADDDDEGGPR